MRMLGALIAVLAVVLAATLLAGCPPKKDTSTISPESGGRPPEGPQVTGEAPPKADAAAGRTLKFALVPKLLDNPVFKLAEEGAQQKARELGDVEVIYQGPATPDSKAQVDIIDSLVRNKVDGISVSCNEAGILKAAIDRAVDAGIPTITFDSDSPDSKRITYYGVDNISAGEKCAELLLKHLGDVKKGEVAFITGVPGAPNLEERIKGATDYLAKQAPDLKVLPAMPCNDDTQKGVTVTKDVLRAHPELAGIIMVGGWPLFAKAPGAFEGQEPGQGEGDWFRRPPERAGLRALRACAGSRCPALFRLGQGEHADSARHRRRWEEARELHRLGPRHHREGRRRGLRQEVGDQELLEACMSAVLDA